MLFSVIVPQLSADNEERTQAALPMHSHTWQNVVLKQQLKGSARSPRHTLRVNSESRDQGEQQGPTYFTELPLTQGRVRFNFHMLRHFLKECIFWRAIYLDFFRRGMDVGFYLTLIPTHCSIDLWLFDDEVKYQYNLTGRLKSFVKCMICLKT